MGNPSVASTTLGGVGDETYYLYTILRSGGRWDDGHKRLISLVTMPK